MNENIRKTPQKITAETETENTLGSKSVPGLLKDLANDITSLFTKEVALAKSEINHSIGETKAAVISMISGGAVLYAGFLFLLLSAFIGLSNFIDPWMAALAVGGVVVVVGFIMLSTGKKKMESAAFKPEHTINSLRKDREVVRGVAR